VIGRQAWPCSPGDHVIPAQRAASSVRMPVMRLITTDAWTGAEKEPTISTSSHPYSIVTIESRNRGENPLTILKLLDDILLRALMTTGLFEEFDVSGRVLQVAPSETARRMLAWQIEC
jgi:hypothetical protein